MNSPDGRGEPERVEEGQPGGSRDSLRERRRRLRATLFGTAEGYLLISGLSAGFLYSAGLALLSIWWPTTAQSLVGLTAMQIVFGRAAGLSMGYAAGLDHRLVLGAVLLMETLVVLVVYPLFVFSWRQLLVVRALARPMRRIHEAAERHRKAIRRYGIVGLALFVWFPCFGTGPVIGSIIGFLLGMRWWVSVLAVLCGTYLAVISWAFLLRSLLDRLSRYTAYAPLVFIAIVVAAVVVARILAARRRRGSQGGGTQATDSRD